MAALYILQHSFAQPVKGIQEAMDLRSVEEHKEKLLQCLKSKDGVLIIFLVGVSGIGKTWMARQITNCAISDNLCYATLWVTMTEEFDTKLLYWAIARQLSLSSITEELEDEEEIAEQKEVNVPELKKMLRAKLKEQRRTLCEGKKYLLLVLDDISGNKIKGKEVCDQVLQGLKDVLPSIDYNCLKILITVREIEEGCSTEQTIKVKFEPLYLEESLDLLGKKVDNKAFENQRYKPYFQDIARNSGGLPAAITMIADTLNFIKRHSSGSCKLETALREAANYQKGTKHVNPLVFCAYDMLQGAVLRNCFWYSMAFFRKYGNVHYNELIAHWIIEGYFDRFEHIEEAYKKGHLVLMELIDRGMLKILEGNIIALEGAALNILDCCPHVFAGIESLRLPTAFENRNHCVLGRTTMMDGMIKTLCNSKSWEEVSTLLIDGSRLCREVHETFFSAMNGLEVLAIFNPWIKSLTFSSFKMEKLIVVVLRNCDLLEEITNIQNLKLTVLEISGAKCLKSIPDQLFSGMTSTLRSLNLSGLQIELLPSTFYELRHVRVLILKGCSRLKKLRSLEEFCELQMLDLSGASSLCLMQEEVVDKSSNSKKRRHGKWKDKTFVLPSKVQTIDLSGTKIQQLPKFLSKGKSNTSQFNADQLTRLSLRGCLQFRCLPSLKRLPGLQILDLSESINFYRFKDASIENLDNLRVLNLSKTSIKKLPPIPCNLSELNLSGCPNLGELPCTTALKKLELLDVSDTPKLAEIEDKSFEHLTCLHSLNLSNTKVKNLTWLSNLTNLRQLFLRDCLSLENLPKMEGLAKLEVLDLSGSTAVRSLQLVEKLSNLQKLLLSGCSSLQQLPSLNSLACLEVLNLSKSGIKEPSPEIFREPEEENAERLPEDVNSGHCDIYKPTETRSNGKKPIIVVKGTRNLQRLKDIFKSEGAYLKTPFRIVENSGNGDEFMYRDIYFRTKQIPCHAKEFLEIRGFNSFPAGLMDILKDTEYISLTDNIFIESLSELAAESFTKVKGCWLERCLEMSSIFSKKQRDDKLSQELKILWVSNLPKLKDLYDAKLKYINFQNLTLLHLDCCPKLKTVFTSSHFPRYLEILQITFCDSLKSVFGKNKSYKPTLSKLHTLLLFGLPELTTIGAYFPQLRSPPKIFECPELPPAEYTSTKDESGVSNYQTRKWPHVTSGLTRSRSM